MYRYTGISVCSTHCRRRPYIIQFPPPPYCMHPDKTVRRFGDRDHITTTSTINTHETAPAAEKVSWT